ncbi:hypothetical protein EsH8_V_000177 [Colletotrichum jinshuiense]
MKYTVVTSFLIALVAADAVSDLVAQIPTCAETCIQEAAKSINCDVSDFSCVCAKLATITSTVVQCISTSSCSATDQAKVLQLAPEICAQVAKESVTAATAAATETGSQTAAATGSMTGAVTSTTTKPAAAGKVQAAGWAGAIAAAAAFAL